MIYSHHRSKSLVLALAVSLLAGGCTRTHYRRKADKDTYKAVAETTADPRWQVPGFSINPSPASRFYDPNNPDRPPLPPDDPESHQIMHEVDGKHGWKHWHRNGDTPWVENPNWQNYLPWNEHCELVLRRNDAVTLALIQSPDYQTILENIYLSALDVTFEEFRFDTQFFFANQTYYESLGRVRNGGESSSKLHVNTQARAEKLFASGGEFVIGIANSLVWEFSGPNNYSGSSLLNFTFLQPLLREAGRAVVLEQLTQAQRALLANLRQFEQYRRSFYVQVVAGGPLAGTPARGGLNLGQLNPPRNVTSAGGFLGLVEGEVNIRNQENNLIMLRGNVERLQSLYDAGRLTNKYQVFLTEQSLYNSEVRFRTSLSTYEDRLDDYKTSLGLPPDIPVRLVDPLTDKFNLIEEDLTRDIQHAEQVVAELSNPGSDLPTDWRTQLSSILEQVPPWWEKLAPDLSQLQTVIQSRRDHLTDLEGRAVREKQTRAEAKAAGRDLPPAIFGDLDPAVYRVEAFVARVREIGADRLGIYHRYAHLRQRLREFPEQPPRPPESVAPGDRAGQQALVAWEQWWDEFIPLAADVTDLLAEVTLVQARARLETLSLAQIHLKAEDALSVARANRPDWMNARAALVDQWRQVEIAANALKSNLAVRFEGDLGTVGENPFRFRDTNGRLRIGFEFDAPLLRVVERNAYRETLIGYQRARRDYYQFEDRVNQNLRSILRTIDFSQLNFEIQRAAVWVAIQQYDLARLNLSRPPKPGEKTSDAGGNVGRDLIDALNNLLNAQNALLGAWVDYEAQRMDLFLEMGIMQLDECGLWIDPGPITGDMAPTTPPEPLPPEVTADGQILTPPAPVPSAPPKPPVAQP